MRRVRWSRTARDAQRSWLEHLEAIDPRLTDRALAESETLSRNFGRRPYSFRPSRWPGLREASLLPWHKILVFEVTKDEVVVIAFYDTRQDLSRTHPTPESS